MANPKITLSAGTSPKEGAIGSYLISLDTAAPVDGLTVYYTTTGTATFNGDYNFTAGANLSAVTANSFTIAAGQTGATLNVTATSDAVLDPNETVILTLATGTGYQIAAVSDSSFAPKTDVSVGAYPLSVISADFNGDGKLDLATANADDDTVSVRLGDGSGGFSGTIEVPVGNSPISIISADFNGDGKLDLATADDYVSVRLGDGSGGFSGTATVSVGDNPTSIISADFNGDGKLDLATANYDSKDVSVRLGDGSGGFSGTATVSVGYRPYSVISADFNGDGKLDLATANGISNNVSVLLGDGSGGFSGTTTVPVGKLPASIISADFNGDGKLDLATANVSSNNVSVRLGDGNGGFTGTTEVPVGYRPYSVISADFNGDGKLDLATTILNFSSAAFVGLGDGSGGFSGTTTVPVSNYPYSSISADFNGDGKPDLAAATYSAAGSNVSVLLNTTVAPSATLIIADVVPPPNNPPIGIVMIDDTTPEQGNVLTASNTLADADSSNGLDAISYTWKTDATVLGTSNTYIVTANEVGKAITVTASYTDGLGNAESVSSQPTSTVRIPVITNHLPTGNVIINDITPEQNQTLSVLSTLADADGLGLITYQWKANGVNIGTGNSYTLTGNEVSKTITVIASYTDGLGKTESVSSSATIAVTEPTSIAVDDGIIITNVGDVSSQGQSVTVQADGKILLGGYIWNYNNFPDFALVRYNSNGSLDTSFDSDGRLTTVVSNGNNEGYSVAVQADGKILLGGWGFVTTGGDFALVRYNSNGSLDISFDGDGKVTTDLGGYDSGYSVAVQADGKILLGGESYNGNGYDSALVRYNTNGSLDTSFGNAGKVTTDQGSSYGFIHSIAVQADDKILLSGYSNSNDLILLRYNSDGSLDTSFDGDGKVTTDLGGSYDYGRSITIQADGKILLGGYSNNYHDSNGYDFALVRYNNDGSLDTSFDGDGKVTTDLGGSYDMSNSVTVQTDGKILLGGSSGSNYDKKNFALVRYNNDGSLDASFDGDGKVTTKMGGSDNQGNSVTIQTDGKILLGGWSGNTDNPDFALVRYNSDGSLDTSFNGLGLGIVNHVPTGTVTIAGNAIKGQTLTASNTLADADGLGVISYLWQANGVNVATGNIYTLTSNEIGKTVTVTARYTDLLGSAESVSSASTVAVTDVYEGGAAAGVTITGTDFITSEQSDTAIFSVKLNSAPTRDVTIDFSSSDISEGIIANSTLKFTSTNWSAEQTFTVTGQNDTVVDGNVAYSINAKLTTLDIFYKSVTTNTLTLTNQDTPIAKTETITGTNSMDILQGTSAPSYILGEAGDDDLSGGAGNDKIYGSYGDDLLFGEDDDDKLYGEQDADYLDGGAGNDTLDGGLGLDTLMGGAGNDIYYLGYDETDIIDDQGLASDVDTVIMPYQLSKYTLPTGIEKGTIAAGTQASNLTGNTSDNALTGNGGKNTLNGAVGRDSLFGGAGNDVLLGGIGNDTLSGGTGKDIFKFNSALTANTDKIADFKPIDDTIQLENAIFTKLTKTGVINGDNFVTATAALDSNDYLIYNKTTGALSYDADGSGAGAGVQIAMLGVNLALTPADFVII
ncbi:MAG: FG-GAP-like repeat-containing protein [Methylococcaceae bacterium]